MRSNLKKSKPVVQSPRLTRIDFCALKFKEFCKRTDLHGFKYITMEGLSVAERSVWAVTVVISIICAIFLVVTAYRWYARNPIVTVVETTQGVIWDIPFPAVTICDLNIVSRKAARSFTQELMSLPDNVTADFVFNTLKLAPVLHFLNKAQPDQKKDLQILQDILDLNSITIEMLFKKISPASLCSNLMERCMWKNTIYRCNQIFRHIFVAVNLCCTFNYYAVDDVDNELKVFRFPTPRRVASCGYQTALTIIVKTDPTDYYSTSFASLGSLVIVDNAYNVPDLDSPMRMVDPSAELVIAVSAERTYATPGIKSFPVHERQCYYTDEMKIPNFNQYSFHNCMAVRKAQILKNVCNCVPFFFPNKDRNRVCNFNDIDCLEIAMNMSSFNESAVSEDTQSDEKPEKLMECLPECEYFAYPLQVAIGTVSDRVPLTGIEFYKDVDLKNRSVVNVFFNDLVATRYRRDAYLNWQNVLAAFGGLLSLMLGFTVVSVFDFILFFTLQVLYDSVIRFFKSDDLHQTKTTQDYFINVEEYKKYGRVKPAKFTTPKLKNYKDLERKQADLLYQRIRY
ncbi:sodium channel protein Nach-like [Maniola hyperantus]|uniref:sodium channel protein Nach-like n=1 Tax=Aphantopus hyperantus TaxID=2795564 RepID=UPI001569C66D|nr:sodium channel protein Nach-like [Maniola hyperantus]